MTLAPTRPDWQGRFLTELAPHECFVFGSNRAGFHGAGAAGFAHRGDGRNTWRSDAAFRDQMARHRRGERGEALRGRWSVYGMGRGYQQGRLGQSYAVMTVQRPGDKRSVTLREIYAQLLELRAFSLAHPELCFLITPLGEGGAGYTETEMERVWQTLETRWGFPENWHFIRPL